MRVKVDNNKLLRGGVGELQSKAKVNAVRTNELLKFIWRYGKAQKEITLQPPLCTDRAQLFQDSVRKQLRDPHLVFLTSDLLYAVSHIRILYVFSPFSKRIRSHTWHIRIDLVSPHLPAVEENNHPGNRFRAYRPSFFT